MLVTYCRVLSLHVRSKLRMASSASQPDLSSFPDCHSYIVSRLAGGTKPREWAKLLDDITDTLPARTQSTEEKEGEEELSDRKRMLLQQRRRKIGIHVVKPHMKEAFVLGICAEMGKESKVKDLATNMVCLSDWPSVALSLLDHCRSQCIPLGGPHKELALKIVAKSSQEISTEEDETLLALCDDVRAELADANPSSATARVLGWAAIAALSKSSRWHDAVAMRRGTLFSRVPKHVKAHDSNSMLAAVNLAIRASREGRLDVAWKVAKDPNFHQHRSFMWDEEQQPVTQLAEEVLKREKQSRATMTDLLVFLSGLSYAVEPALEKALKVASKEAESSFTVEDCKISPHGTCSSTSSQLTRENLTSKEFGLLQTAVLENMLIAGNVYKSSTPAEAKKFVQSLDACRSYDVVVDGLNVALGGSPDEKQAIKAQRLVKTVKVLKDRGLNVLVVGRKHIAQWKAISALDDICELFLFDNM